MLKTSNSVANIRTACPFCSEKIAIDAKKCHYCGEWLNKSLTVKPTSFSKKKIFLVVIAVIVFLILKEIFWSISTNTNSQTPTIQPTEKSLRQTAEEQYRLLASGKTEDWTRLYNEFYTPDHNLKKKNLKDSVSINLEHRLDMINKGLNHVEFQIHSVKVNGAVGYVDRTEIPCSNSDCTKAFAPPRRLTRKYIFVGNTWLMTDDEVLCTRTNPYDMEPEFKRALSLITQRTENYALGAQYKQIENCLSIKYANSVGEMNGAEGLFSFYEGKSIDKLDILVSPKYKTKDDLITAILLIHEIDHALSYAVQGDASDCYENEAAAYSSQIAFMLVLNKEEIDSLNARLATGASDELIFIKYIWDGMTKAKGVDPVEQGVNFVKSNPAYVKQCANQ